MWLEPRQVDQPSLVGTHALLISLASKDIYVQCLVVAWSCLKEHSKILSQGFTYSYDMTMSTVTHRGPECGRGKGVQWVLSRSPSVSDSQPQFFPLGILPHHYALRRWMDEPESSLVWRACSSFEGHCDTSILKHERVWLSLRGSRVLVTVHKWLALFQALPAAMHTHSNIILGKD